MAFSDWFLDEQERPWTVGNDVSACVHGASYFPELVRAVRRMRSGDLLLFADWRGDPDERILPDGDLTVDDLLTQAAERGVQVRGLIWRSHWDKLQFSAEENRRLGDRINRAGGVALLDMRVRAGGSHHQKFVVLRHPGRPQLDVAFVGGIDLCHSRRDSEAHRGDPQPQPMAAIYRPRPPWHDIQTRITGPAVAEVETVFRERWNDPHVLSRNPWRWTVDHLRRRSRTSSPDLPAQLPAPPRAGEHSVQLLRTYPRRRGGYPFAPDGERTVARGVLKAINRAERLIYIEDQYLWSDDIGRRIAAALRRNPELSVVAVVPHYPDQDGALSLPPNLVGRNNALNALAGFGDRVAVYGLENEDGTPIYVHAKLIIVDDEWTAIGSANLNRRSWTHDSELTAAILGADFGRRLRTSLAGEHLQADPPCADAAAMCTAFAESAARLQRWRDAGGRGPRPPGRLRPVHQEQLSRFTRAWSTLLYHRVYDPDGRPRRLKKQNAY